jgi:hypothetical protein
MKHAVTTSIRRGVVLPKRAAMLGATVLSIVVACADRGSHGSVEETSAGDSTASLATSEDVASSADVGATAPTDGSETSVFLDIGATEGPDVDGDACTVDGCAARLGDCEACCGDRPGEDVPTVSDGTCTEPDLYGDWQCVLERMRDGAPTKLEFAVVSAMGGGIKPCTYYHYVVLLGDGTALHMTTDLREFFVSEVRHVVLRPPQYFTDCLKETDELQIARCFTHWFEDGEICEPFDCCADPAATWCE